MLLPGSLCQHPQVLGSFHNALVKKSNSWYMATILFLKKASNMEVVFEYDMESFSLGHLHISEYVIF